VGVARSLCRRVLLDSNRILSIVMALSTTCTQYAPENTKFGKNNAKYGPFRRSRSFKVTDFGTNRKLIHDFLLVINRPTNLPPILHCFGDTAFQKSQYFATPLAFKSPDGGVPWDNLRKIFSECQWMAKVPEGEEKLPKISTR